MRSVFLAFRDTQRPRAPGERGQRGPTTRTTVYNVSPSSFFFLGLNTQWFATCSSSAASRHANLTADFLQLWSNLAGVLSREASRASSSSADNLRVDDTNDILDVPLSKSKACDDATQANARAGKMRVFAKIDVQHQSLASLNEHLDLLRLRIPHQRFSIDDEGCERHSAYLEKGKLFLHILLQEVGVTLLLFVQHFINTNSATGSLGGITWVDTPLVVPRALVPSSTSSRPSTAAWKFRLRSVTDEDALAGVVDAQPCVDWIQEVLKEQSIHGE
ncbi:hypothetical protein M441DRAFT_455937 [Trichoderma asperellum CBS 433.97]|uniref:Uncharacterized protein n=1 Tax=Trichoderma asperellum (strain ATCC 204424 / CBS 433.97 / NBRC 101777) TaxID=1042311 RepID=A0A2T3ZAT4_TRIA4|nr:hypothetical protein M441DRAFT_455937 [Trichoderma asperellum CBS 433.97]PTB41924.1 hypothetical protein M441DRAFT_455937 [Trichoderma asperellum CBS 433.97]